MILGSAGAQVTAGDNVNLSLSGDIATGYSGSFADSSSGHNLTVGGNANLHGYYYNPQFISFDIQPYYNRSQSNSTYQSLTNSSGIMATANFFGGSNFPGSVSYTRSYDNTGQFGIPGVTGLDTTGSGQTLNFTWSELVPGLPSLHASYTITGQNVSIPGAEGDSHLGSRMLSLSSDYVVYGFRLRGFYGNSSNHSEFPSFLSEGRLGAMNGGSNSYGGSVTHGIPFRGYWTAQVTHSGFTSDYGNGAATGASGGTNTGLSTTVTINPLEKLGMGFSAEYQTNAFGALQQQILESGGINQLRLSEDNSNTAGVSGSASYTISRYVFLTGQFSHREQNFAGEHFGITQYGGAASFNFSRRLLGALSFSVGANDTATQLGNNGAGLYTNVNFSRRLQAWEVSSNFTYNQAVQTLMAAYTTSMYGYGANIRRKFRNELYWGANFNGSHSGLQRVAGSTSHANTFSTYLSFRRYNLNGVYSQSEGISVLTAQGLIPVPSGIPSPLLANLMLYDAKSYGGGFGATLKRLHLSVSYSRSISDTAGPSVLLNNNSTFFNARLRYRVRKMYFDSGFTQFHQSIGAVGAQPTVINSYYFGISRWFNVF